MNRFCGMCGVRLERRKADRRVSATGANLKCESCGNVNDLGYKFCGMCGNRIERRIADRRGGPALHHARTDLGGNVAVAVSSTAVREAESVGSRSPEPVLHHTPPAFQRSHTDEAFHSEPVGKSGIQGPSFLGLSDDSDDDGTYLLEEENTSRSGLRKLVLLVILAAIAGLIFVQYRSSLHANPKPAPAQSGPQGQTQQPAAISGGAANPQAAGPNLAAASPAQPNTQQPSTSDPASTAAASSQPADAPPQVTPVKADGPEIDPANLAEKSDPDVSGNKADKHNDSSAAGKSIDPVVPAEQKPSAALVRAQQFLLGKGVEQNCEQGLLYLRAAAQKNEPAAAVQMGALYASGHCVHQDRVMAYRWFNSAHELQPANQWIQRNMDLLWGQMTDQERRLAGY